MILDIPGKGGKMTGEYYPDILCDAKEVGNEV
jgi:hypothetical protein